MRCSGRIAAALAGVVWASAGRGDSLTLYAGSYNGVASGNPFGTVYADGSINTGILITSQHDAGVLHIYEGRSLFEFPLASLPAGAVISSATVSAYVFAEGSPTYDRLAVSAYAGDGAITAGDFAGGTAFLTYNTPFPFGTTATIDATAPVKGLVSGGAAWAGFNIRDTTQAYEILNFSTFYYGPGIAMCPTLTINYSLAGPSWSRDASGSWNVASNWANGTVPNGAGAAVTLGAAAVTQARTISVDSPVTAGALTIGGTNSYTVAGAAKVTFASGTALPATLTVNSGSHQVLAPIALGSDLTVNNQGTLALGEIKGPHALRFSGAAGHTVAVTGNIAVASLNIDYYTRLDMRMSSAVLTGTTEDQVRDYVTSLRIISTDEGDITFEGVITNSDGAGHPLFTTFDGMPAPYGCTLMRFTYFGDTDFNGCVDGADLANLLAGMNGGLHGWQNGDIDYSGTIDGTDLYYMIGILQEQGKPFPDLSGGNGGGGSAVPEPGLAAVGLSAGIALASRRRR